METRTVEKDQLGAEQVFEERMGRIKALTGAKTQVQLAEVLDVRQSSVSDAKRRKAIPKTWLVKLLKSHKALPEWVMEGTGPQFLDEAVPSAQSEAAARLKGLEQELASLAQELEADRKLARMTAEDFLTAKAKAEVRLGEGVRVVAAMQAEAQGLRRTLAH